MALGKSPPSLFLPAPPDKYDRSWLARFSAMIMDRMDTKLAKGTAETELYLLSPAGKTFKITVSDTGTITAVLVNG